MAGTARVPMLTMLIRATLRGCLCRSGPSSPRKILGPQDQGGRGSRGVLKLFWKVLKQRKSTLAGTVVSTRILRPCKVDVAPRSMTDSDTGHGIAVRGR